MIPLIALGETRLLRVVFRLGDDSVPLSRSIPLPPDEAYGLLVAGYLPTIDRWVVPADYPEHGTYLDDLIPAAN